MRRKTLPDSVRESVRIEWETTPVTFSELEIRLGSGTGTMRQHAFRNGWERRPDVVVEAKKIHAQRVRATILAQVAAGTYVQPSKRPGAKPTHKREWPKPINEPRARRYSSVFDYAAGCAA